MEMDELDRLGAEAFRGLVVRKDLVRQFRGQFPVPTYVVEFMLGRYCATTDQKEIDEGLQVVRTQLSSRTVRAGEDELIKSRARETGSARVIDIITARLDAKSDSYLATLPSLRLTDLRISDETVRENERMLTGGFYAEIDLGYDATIAQEKGGRPFQANAVRPIQLSTRGVLDRIIEGRAKLTTAQWKDFLLRSVGLEPGHMSPRARDISLMRMIPFVERNYNMIELGPRGTGKSHLYQQTSPYSHLVSGGKATVARMFVNMANGQRGLVWSASRAARLRDFTGDGIMALVRRPRPAGGRAAFRACRTVLAIQERITSTSPGCGSEVARQLLFSWPSRRCGPRGAIPRRGRLVSAIGCFAPVLGGGMGLAAFADELARDSIERSIDRFGAIAGVRACFVGINGIFLLFFVL